MTGREGDTVTFSALPNLCVSAASFSLVSAAKICANVLNSSDCLTGFASWAVLSRQWDGCQPALFAQWSIWVQQAQDTLTGISGFLEVGFDLGQETGLVLRTPSAQCAL